jgi:hypothetical protein
MKNIILLTLITIICLSCNKDDSEYSQFMNSNSIQSNVEFQIIENYSTYGAIQPPTLKLRLKTVDQFGCSNYSITTTEFNNGNELIIRFEEIFKPTFCLTSIGPAETVINLTDNISKLVFLNSDNVDIYSITINSQEVEISEIENNFTNLLSDKTFRYPEKSFAFVCGTNTDNTYIYNDFLNLLVNNQTLTEIQFDNTGRIPFTQSSSGHWVNHESRYFKYKNTSDFEDLGQVLSDFTTQNIIPDSGVTIRLTSWDNRQHLSWIE